MQSLRVETVKELRRDKNKRNVIWPPPSPPLFGPLDNLVDIAKVAKPTPIRGHVRTLEQNF